MSGGSGIIIKDAGGNFVAASSACYGISSNSLAKVKSKSGLLISFLLQLRLMDLESDHRLLLIGHIYWEVNGAAGFLA